MYLSTYDVADLVRNEVDAEALISMLLEKFASQAAQARLEEEARFSKQSTQEVARRAVSNLLTSFATRRNDVYSW